MQLVLLNEHKGDVVVVRCRGRIVTGQEAQFLQGELDKLTQLTKTLFSISPKSAISIAAA